MSVLCVCVCESVCVCVCAYVCLCVCVFSCAWVEQSKTKIPILYVQWAPDQMRYWSNVAN